MTLQTEAIPTKAVEDLRARLWGTLLRPGDEDYDEARAAWNLNARQRPSVVVMAEGADDVLAAVRFARDEGLGVGVMATGHGTVAPCDGGRARQHLADAGRPDRSGARTARVEAGAKWADVVPEAEAHGLAGLPGSSTGVGVVGYTMGGGFGWLGRKYGLAADSVKEAEVVTADGELVRASAHENADLFWGLGGGGGNFGIVTSLEFALHPVGRASTAATSSTRSRGPVRCWRSTPAWNRTLPDEMTSAVAFRNFPPLPTVPETFPRQVVHRRARLLLRRRPRRGRSVARARARGARGARRRHLRGHARRAIGHDQHGPGEPDRRLTGTPSCCATSRRRPSRRWSGWRGRSSSPLIMLELRQLGGALARPPSELSPMGRSDARFTMNAIGATLTPEMAQTAPVVPGAPGRGRQARTRAAPPTSTSSTSTARRRSA